MKLSSWMLYCLVLSYVVASNGNIEVIARLEKSLLKVFGLKEKPKVDATKKKIPSHMMQLYKMRELQEQILQRRVKRELNEDIDPDVNEVIETEPPKNINIYGNTIRSYKHTESPSDNQHASYEMLLNFNVASLPKEEILRNVELRLYHAVHPSAPSAVENKIKELEVFQRIYVYDILRPSRGKSDEIRRLLDTKVIDSRINDTLSLDVRSAIKRWVRKPKRNHGLYVEVFPLKPNLPESSIRDGKNIRLRRSLNVKEDSDEWSEEQPLLVIHTDDEFLKPREKRSPPSHIPSKRPICKRHKLYVDFSKVEWTTWIVAPPGYDAYYCHGDCPYPLAHHMNTTNHAIIQNIIHSHSPDRVPSACCVPIKHSAISILYYGAEKEIVLKTYQDMTVESCGCQ